MAAGMIAVSQRVAEKQSRRAGRAVQGCTAKSRRWREDLVSSDLKDVRICFAQVVAEKAMDGLF